MDSDRRDLTPHRREHWGVDDADEPEAAFDVVRTPEETRIQAKRLLWRDSAIILVGIVLALLIAQFLPRSDPGLGADASALASGAGAGTSLGPGRSAEPGTTFGPIVDPSLAIDATRPPRPAVTLPPTGSFDPGQTARPTPRPSKKPPPTSPPTSPPATPKPTPEPTPEITPEITPIPPPVAAFSWSASFLIVTFTNESSDATSWEWDFGDGSGSAERDPEHAYLVPGDYTVRLTVVGPGGADAVDRVVSVLST